MREPSLRTSRLVIAGGFGAAIAIAIGGFLVGRATSPPPQTVIKTIPVPVSTERARDTEQSRVLGRSDLIAFADRAADAAASGLALPEDIDDLAGRRFELVIPFGCNGPSAPDGNAPLRWSYDTESQALRVQVSPTAWRLSDWQVREPPSGPHTAEGFWVSRPWSSEESCPRQSPAITADAQPVTLPGQTLAIAQFRPDRASAGRPREDRSFDTVKRLAPEQLDAAGGFRIRLTGRIGKLPGGQAIRCIQPAGIEQRPICMIAASFDELRVESAGSAGVLATWSIGYPAKVD